jgi:hypothetical protein
MQQILRREPWTTTSSHEGKNWTRTQHTQFIFKPYHVWIVNLYRSAVGGYRTDESIMSGVNRMELVLSPSCKASHQIVAQTFFYERVLSILIDRCHRLKLTGLAPARDVALAG